MAYCTVRSIAGPLECTTTQTTVVRAQDSGFLQYKVCMNIPHDRQLTIISGQLRNRNYINRMLFKELLPYRLSRIFTCIRPTRIFQLLLNV